MISMYDINDLKTVQAIISDDFQSESGFDPTKDRRIEMRGLLECIEKIALPIEILGV